MAILFLLLLSLVRNGSSSSNAGTINSTASWKCPSDGAGGAGDVTFFIVGDQGRGGTSNQRSVALMMGQLATDCYKPQFVVSTGDNFYEHGIKSSADPFFTQTFTNVYTAKGLQVPWYAVLGNHDYGEFKDSKKDNMGCTAYDFAQCSACCYSATWQATDPGAMTLTGKPSVAALDARWNLQQGAWRKSFGRGALDLVFIDTVPFLKKYHNKWWSTLAGGVGFQNVSRQLQDIHRLLGESAGAVHRVVVGHHPMRSFGEHCYSNRGATPQGGDCAEMQFLQPILQQYKVDLYVSGHDHNQQLFSPQGSDTLQAISGAGSDVRTGAFDLVPADVLQQNLLYVSEKPGFLAVRLSGGSMRLDWWAVDQQNRAHTSSWNAQRSG